MSNYNLDLFICLFSSVNFCFTHFPVLLFCAYLGFLCLLGHLTLLSLCNIPLCLSLVIVFAFFFFFFLQPHLWHMEVPGLGVELELHTAGLCHTHSNTRSKLHLKTMPQLVAMPDP